MYRSTALEACLLSASRRPAPAFRAPVQPAFHLTQPVGFEALHEQEFLRFRQPILSLRKFLSTSMRICIYIYIYNMYMYILYIYMYVYIYTYTHNIYMHMIRV